MRKRLVKVGRIIVLFAAALPWFAASRAEAAWPKPGDVLVLTETYDAATFTPYPYVVAVDPVTKNRTIVVDFSTFTDPEIFRFGMPLVPNAVAESRDGVIWVTYSNSWADYSSQGFCHDGCGGVVVRINADGSHAVVPLGWGIYPTGLAPAPDGSVILVAAPFGYRAGPFVNRQLYRLRAIDAVTSSLQGFQVPGTLANPACAAPITIAYLGQDADLNTSPPGNPGERYAYLDAAKNPLPAAIAAGITEVTDAAGSPVPVQTYIDAGGQPAAHIDSSGYIVVGDICDFDQTAFAYGFSVAVDQTTGTDIYVGDVNATSARSKFPGTNIPYCQQFGYSGCGGLDHLIVTDPATLTAGRPTLLSDFGDPRQGTPIGSEAGTGVAILGNQFLVTDRNWWIAHNLQNTSSDPCAFTNSTVECSVYGALFLVNQDGTRQLLSAFGYASAYGGAQGQTGNTGGNNLLPIAVTLDGTILIGACDGSNGINSGDSICQVDGPTSATPGLRTLWSDFGTTYNGRQLLGAIAMSIVPPSLARTPTTTTLTPSSISSTYGQSITFTASVTGAGGTPSGSVTFNDSATTLGVVALAGGSASLDVSTLTAATHSITASYGGDATFASSVSAPLVQTVNQASTTTALASSVNPAASGQAVTFTATVSPQFTGTPTGNVTFNEGATTLGTAALTGGVAALTLNSLADGLHPVSAIYSGDANFLNSGSLPLNEVVGQSADLAVSIAAIPVRPLLGSTFTLTITAQNNGPADVSAATAKLTLSGMTFVSANPAAAYNSATGVWTIGGVVNGAASQLTLTVVMAGWSGTATAFTTSATPPDPVAANNFVSLFIDPLGVIFVNSTCHLREAIVAANTDAAFGGCPAGNPGPDIIVLPPLSVIEYSDVYQDLGGAIGPNQLPAITSPITIEGQGSIVGRNAAAAIPAMRVFYVAPGGDLTLHDLTVRRGVASYGGGILVVAGGSLTLDGAWVVASQSGIDGGGIANGIAVGGTVTITNSIVAGNSAAAAGGGVSSRSGTLTITNSTIGGGVVNGVSFGGNSAGSGGGLAIRGPATLTNAAIGGGVDADGNSAVAAGGGILVGSGGSLTMTGGLVSHNRQIGGPGPPGHGGGIANGNRAAEPSGTVDLINVFVTFNQAAGVGGGAWSQGTLHATGGSMSQNHAGAGGGFANGGDATLTSVVVAQNTGDNDGGGVLSLGATTRLSQCVVDGNFSSGAGGGLAQELFTGMMVVTDGTLVTNNAAVASGGGVAVFASAFTMTGGVIGNNVSSASWTTSGGGGALTNGMIGSAPGTVTLTGVTIANNSAPNNGNGGAIFNGGTLNITGGTFTGNKAGASGGAIGNGTPDVSAGPVTLNAVAFSQNTAATFGGAIFNRGHLDMTGGTLMANTALSQGGGIMNRGGNVTLTNTVLDGNSGFGGGNLYSENDVSGGVLTVHGGQVKNGSAQAGGGVFSSAALTLDQQVVISDNTATATDGGGVDVIGAGPVLISNATISANHAPNGIGGGLLAGGTGDVVITNTTLASNEAQSGQAIWATSITAPATPAHVLLASSVVTANYAPPGYPFLSVALFFNGFGTTGLVANTTISGNHGSALVAQGANVTVRSATIVGNAGPAISSDSGAGASGTVSFLNSIVSGNQAADGTFSDCRAAGLTSNGYNVLGRNTGCPMTDTDILVDPASVFASVLGPLADNGGPTQTHALLAGSPAIDAANPFTFGPFACETTDERGLPRPIDGDGDGNARCDIGAFEQQTVLPSPMPVLNTLFPGRAAPGDPAFTLQLIGSGFVAGSVTTWNGAPRKTQLVSPTQLLASIPASDLVTGKDFATADVGVNNPGGLTSNTLPFFVTAASLAVGSSTAIPEGIAPPPFGVDDPVYGSIYATGTNNTAGSGAMRVNLAVFKSNPTLTTLFAAGAFYDLQVIGADPTDTVTASFYYPPSITGAAETALQLQYWTGAAWAPVLTSGGGPPAKNTTDNLDFTTSGGRFTVTFDMTSTPTILQLTGTVFAVAPIPGTVEAAIQFDPLTRDLVVVPTGGAVASLKQGPGDLRTYTIADGARHTLTLAIDVKKAGQEIKAHIQSVQYGGAPAVAAPDNALNFEWSAHKGGAIETLEQKLTVGTGRSRQQAQAEFQSTKNQTRISVTPGPTPRDYVQTGLVLLQLVTDKGMLRISVP